MTERLPRLVFVTLALACSLAAPSTWAVTGKNSCLSPARIVDADQLVPQTCPSSQGAHDPP